MPSSIVYQYVHSKLLKINFSPYHNTVYSYLSSPENLSRSVACALISSSVAFLWHRSQETYGEDPYLTGRLAQHFVRGLQGDHPRYLRTVSTCKHFLAHTGPENIPESRHRFNAIVMHFSKYSTSASLYSYEYLIAFDMPARPKHTRKDGLRSLLANCRYQKWICETHSCRISRPASAVMVPVGVRQRSASCAPTVASTACPPVSAHTSRLRTMNGASKVHGIQLP